jgi:hypothetical protein
LLAIAFRPFGPYLEYGLNRSHIAKEYCVNQDKPERGCNGSCYLMQQLKKQAENRADHDWSPVETAESVNLMMPVQVWGKIAQEAGSGFPDHAGELPPSWIAPPVAPPPRRA